MKSLLLTLGLLASCASAPQVHEFQKTWTMTSDFDRTWAATVEVFAEHGWSIATLEKASGIIVSEWLHLNAADAAEFYDRGNSGLATTRTREAKFNVFVRQNGADVTLTVNASFREQRSFDQSVWYQECTSLGALEARLYSLIAERLSS